MENITDFPQVTEKTIKNYDHFVTLLVLQVNGLANIHTLSLQHRFRGVSYVVVYSHIKLLCRSCTGSKGWLIEMSSDFKA